MTDHHKPLVSVVMPVYNSEKYLAEAIESILAQTFNDFELIIVDDASEDSSAAISRSYADRDRRIQCLQLERNMGAASARNAGLDAARGDFIAAMDADDVCLPERFRKQLDFLQAHPEIGVVGCSLQLFGETAPSHTFYLYPEEHCLIIFRILCTMGSGLGGASTMMRRDVLNAVGGYRANMRNRDDIDLWLRLARHTRFANLPDVLYLYRLHEQSYTVLAGAAVKETGRALRKAALQQLWPDASDEKLNRILHSHTLGSMLERVRLRRDIRRLIDILIAANWIDASDKPRLHAEAVKRFTIEPPHFIRRLRAWFRYRIGRHLSAL